MQEFNKDEYIDYEDVVVDEIIKFDNHYLKVKEDDSCENCFFGENKKYDCNTLIGCIGDGLSYKYIELTEIETLIMFDKYKNDLIKMCNKKSKEFLLREFKSLEIVEIFKKTLENCNK